MKIVKENLPIERRVLSKKEALELFAEDPYKVELISELPEDETITAYQQGEFVDLCRGPHVPSNRTDSSVQTFICGRSLLAWKFK